MPLNEWYAEFVVVVVIYSECQTIYYYYSCRKINETKICLWEKEPAAAHIPHRTSNPSNQQQTKLIALDAPEYFYTRAFKKADMWVIKFDLFAVRIRHANFVGVCVCCQHSVNDIGNEHQTFMNGMVGINGESSIRENLQVPGFLQLSKGVLRRFTISAKLMLITIIMVCSHLERCGREET